MKRSGLDTLTPSLEVRVGGVALPYDAANSLGTVVVELDRYAPAMFTLELAPRKLSSRDLRSEVGSWIDGDLFTLGAEVEIALGYGTPMPVLHGEVTGFEMDLASDRPGRAVVRGHDRRHRLLRGRKTRAFAGLQLSEIAASIAREAELEPQVEATGTVLDWVVQHDQTDLDFLTEHAHRIGYEIALEGLGQFRFRPRKPTDDARTLTWPGNLLRFSPRASLSSQVSAVELRGFDPTGKEAVVAMAPATRLRTSSGSASGPQLAADRLGAAVHQLGHPVQDLGTAEVRARNQLELQALDFVDAEGEIRGEPSLEIDSAICIEGVGDRFEGLYEVFSIRHVFAPGGLGYRTQLTLRRNAL